MDLQLKLDDVAANKIKQTMSSASEAISYKVEAAAKNTKDKIAGLFK